MARRVLLAQVSGGRVRGRPRLGWMNRVRWPWAKEWRWRRRDNARKIGKSGEPWYISNWMSFTRPFLLGPVFSGHPPVLWCLSPGEGWDAVTRCGWDKLLKACNYWKSRRRYQVYGLRGVCWWLCVCYLTWRDYPSLVEGDSHGILLLWMVGKHNCNCFCFATLI